MGVVVKCFGRDGIVAVQSKEERRKKMPRNPSMLVHDLEN
jgi:ribosomal protein S26